MTPEPEQLDNDYKLRYIAYYLVSKLELTNQANDQLQEALAREDLRDRLQDEIDLDDWLERSTGERDMLWMFEDVLLYLKTQSLTVDQQREADHLMVEAKYYRQALEKQLLLLTELQGPSGEES